jgi:hypothetical protein
MQLTILNFQDLHRSIRATVSQDQANRDLIIAISFFAPFIYLSKSVFNKPNASRCPVTRSTRVPVKAALKASAFVSVGCYQVCAAPYTKRVQTGILARLTMGSVNLKQSDLAKFSNSFTR